MACVAEQKLHVNKSQVDLHIFSAWSFLPLPRHSELNTLNLPLPLLPNKIIKNTPTGSP